MNLDAGKIATAVIIALLLAIGGASWATYRAVIDHDYRLGQLEAVDRAETSQDRQLAKLWRYVSSNRAEVNELRFRAGLPPTFPSNLSEPEP